MSALNEIGFYMSVEICHNSSVLAHIELKQKPLYQQFFSAIYHFSNFNRLLVSSSQVSLMIKMRAKWRHF